jgi:hypothetical protein
VYNIPSTDAARLEEYRERIAYLRVRIVQTRSELVRAVMSGWLDTYLAAHTRIVERNWRR